MKAPSSLHRPHRGLVLLLIVATQVFVAVQGHAACQVSHGAQRNDALRAQVPFDGKFVFEPGGPGFVDRDGALGMKFAWDRFIPGRLEVGGKRLDEDAPPARAYISKAYGNVGFQPIYLVFPTPGCWQITGQVAGRTLSFITLVEKRGAGPSWKYQGIPNDGSWYESQL